MGGDPDTGENVAGRKTWYVKPHDRGWQVLADGAKRATVVTERKNDAVRGAKEIARRNEPSRVVVHKQDGTVQDDISYG